VPLRSPAEVGVARQTLHRWLARYEAGGLDGLGDLGKSSEVALAWGHAGLPGTDFSSGGDVVGSSPARRLRSQ
jgi:hypothetical protein